MLGTIELFIFTGISISEYLFYAANYRFSQKRLAEVDLHANCKVLKQLVLPRTVWNNASHIAPCQKLQYVAMFCFESEFCWQIAPTSLRHLVIFLTSLLHKLQYSQPGSQYKRLSTPHSTSDHLMPTYFHCSCGEIFRLHSTLIRLLTFWFLVALLIFLPKRKMS